MVGREKKFLLSAYRKSSKEAGPWPPQFSQEHLPATSQSPYYFVTPVSLSLDLDMSPS